VGFLRQAGDVPFDVRSWRFVEESTDVFEEEDEDYDQEYFRPRYARSVSEYSRQSDEYLGDEF